MSCINSFWNFRPYFISNFPFLEKDFDALTDYELISKIFEHFEKEIKDLEEQYKDITSIRDEFNAFKIQVQEEMALLSTQIISNVDNKLEENYNNVVQLMSQYQTLFNNQLLLLKEELEAEIEQIELGNVDAYNPTNRTI